MLQLVSKQKFGKCFEKHVLGLLGSELAMCVHGIICVFKFKEVRVC